MCCKSLRTKIIPFALALIVGLVTVGILQQKVFVNKNQEKLFPESEKNFLGKAVGGKFLIASPSETEPLRVISKPRANYTDAARQNQTQGTVNLRITFQADGEIGSIMPVSKLPDGLTEQATAAAREIKFEPAKSDGVPQTVTKLVQYRFTIY